MAEEMQSVLARLTSELAPEKESVLKYRELTSDADKHRAKACAKLTDRRKAVSKLRAEFEKALSKRTIVGEEAAQLDARLKECEQTVEAIGSIKPATGSAFVKIFLGQVNVKVSSQKDKETLRDEYNKFKDITNLAFLIFPVLWIVNAVYLSHVFSYTDWIYTLTHVYLFYYYVTLSLRENILRVNGSNIMKWWIHHHYMSAVLSLVLLTWPTDSDTWHRFHPVFTAYFLYQGLVQLMQARYQKSRHYALTALGKAKSIDVSNTETFNEFHSGLWLIIVLVWIAQLWQVINGGILLWMLSKKLNLYQPLYNYRDELQLLLIGCLFVFLGIRNFVATVQTLRDKSKRARQRQSLAALPPTAARANSNGAASTAGSM